MSPEESADVDCDLGDEQRRERSRRQPFVAGVGIARGLAVDLDRHALKIDNPDFRHAELGVKRKLGSAIIGERGCCDLDNEDNVGGAGVAVLIIVRPRLEEHQIRLRLVVGVEAQWAWTPMWAIPQAARAKC